MQPTELTPIQQAKQAKSWDRYARIYSEVEAEARAELAEYGFTPDKVDSRYLHRETQRRVELEQRHETEDRDEYVASGLY